MLLRSCYCERKVTALPKNNLTQAVPVVGNPDPKRVCTSIVERGN